MVGEQLLCESRPRPVVGLHSQGHRTARIKVPRENLWSLRRCHIKILNGYTQWLNCPKDKYSQHWIFLLWIKGSDVEVKGLPFNPLS